MAVTPDEMRAMAERLDKQADAMVEAGYKGWPNCNRSASEMLHSIAEEREADAKVQNEMRDSILRLKSTVVKNGWIEP